MISPARKISNKGTKKNIGRFFSLKMPGGIWYESLIERDYMYFLEIDPDVGAYCTQPLKISYREQDKQRQYTPDFWVQRKNRNQIVEIKPASQVKLTRILDCSSVLPLYVSLMVGNFQSLRMSCLEKSHY